MNIFSCWEISMYSLYRFIQKSTQQNNICKIKKAASIPYDECVILTIICAFISVSLHNCDWIGISELMYITPHIWYALCGLYSMYYLCVNNSRLENACFVALSNTRILFQTRSHNTHWWTELRLLWMWIHFGANCFL